MSPYLLPQTVDAWTIQAVTASGHLVRLYRSLADDRQAALALQACGPCEERGQRLGLLDQVTQLRKQFLADHPGEIEGEAMAWQLLIEAQAGLYAIHGLVEDHDRGGTLRGNRSETRKAFQRALRGYRVAFPEEITSHGIMIAFNTVAARCAEAFIKELSGVNPAEKQDIQEELQSSIMEALLNEAGN